MIISKKQIMQLMSMCRRYANVCAQMNWKEDHDECKLLHRQIEKQQSEELEDIKS
jgi:hypothetical protein